jgi:hypothetical protein
MKIEEKELNSLKSLHQEIDSMIQALGKKEIEKHHMLHTITVKRQEIAAIEQALFEKYGSVTVNMETGEYQETI